MEKIFSRRHAVLWTAFAAENGKGTYMKATFRKFLFLALLILCPLAAHAGTWEFAGWHGGGAYPNVEYDPSVKGRVYLTSDVTGLWRSNDYGEHWYFITKGLANLMVADVAIAPSDSNVLYAATGGGVYVSKDAGGTWTKADSAGGQITFSRPISYRPVAISPTKPYRVCAGTAKGKVFCSSDMGVSWWDLDPNKLVFNDGKAIRAMSLDPTGNILYVASGRGMNRCVVSSNTCVFLASGPTKVTDFALSRNSVYTIYVAGDTSLWVTHDQGITWSKTVRVPQGTTDRVALDPVSSRPNIRVIWINGWNGGVYLSKDQGATWKGQDANFSPDKINDPTRIWAASGGRTLSLKVDPFNASRVFRTDWWGVWRSDNSGTNWAEKILGAPNTVATQVTVAPDGTLYVSSMDNGLMRSTDGGKTYQAIFPKGYSVDWSGHAWRVALAGNNVIVTSSPWDKNLNQVGLSTDKGATFKLIRQGLPAVRPLVNTMWGIGYPRGLAVDPKNLDIIYLGIDGDDGGGLYVSKDRGQTWARSPGQPGSKRIYYGLAVDPTNSNRIVWGASGSGGGVYVSEDAGLTFKKNTLTQMTWVFDVAIGSDGSIYAAGDSSGAKLYVSRDSGVTWGLLGSFGTGRALGSVAVNPANPQQIAVSTVSWTNAAPCNIFLSQDRGKTWQDVTGVLPQGAGASTLTFDPVNKYLYIGRYAGSVYKLRLD
jgi:photosystem II stability/assembly factor-like uncharacterized protein